MERAHCSFRHRRMFQKHFVDFPRREFLSAPIDDLLLATETPRDAGLPR